MYVCICKAVTDKQVKSAIAEGHCSRRQLNQCLGVGSVCGKCSHHVKQLLNESRLETCIMPMVA
jgi:bacterioferritin-associated ferredoxin|uniref:(2Fe-2S)-binding protein n=1 Tax=Crenothrix polyspora TaxID=360316 RepID=UPI000B34CF1A|nr:(2Fe-2S)-binding protein [Crenothrix polyspora]